MAGIGPPLDAQLPAFSSDRELTRLSGGGGIGVRNSPPRLVLGNGLAFHKMRSGILQRTLQNVGLVPIFYVIQEIEPADYTVQVPTGVVACGDDEYDGRGSIVDLSRDGEAVWVWSDSGTLKALANTKYTSEADFTSAGDYD